MTLAITWPSFMSNQYSKDLVMLQGGPHAQTNAHVLLVLLLLLLVLPPLLLTAGTVSLLCTGLGV